MNHREPRVCDVKKSFERYPNICLEQLGPSFLTDLANYRYSLIYGGYNSLTDVMGAGVPSVVLLRGMKDGEQEEHVAALSKYTSSIVDVFTEENITVDELRNSLEKCLRTNVDPFAGSFNGAANAARYLVELAGVRDANG